MFSPEFVVSIATPNVKALLIAEAAKGEGRELLNAITSGCSNNGDLIEKMCDVDMEVGVKGLEKSHTAMLNAFLDYIPYRGEEDYYE